MSVDKILLVTFGFVFLLWPNYYYVLLWKQFTLVWTPHFPKHWFGTKQRHRQQQSKIVQLEYDTRLHSRSFPSLGRKQFSVIIFSSCSPSSFFLDLKLVPSLLSTVNFSPERLLISFGKQFRFLFVLLSIFMPCPEALLLTEMGLSNQFCQTKDFWVFLR